MTLSEIVLTIAAPWVAILSGLVIPALASIVTKDLTGWIQIAVLSVLSAVAGVVSQGIGADWSFPLVHTLSQVGWVALVAIGAHYGLNVSGVSQKLSAASRGFGFEWRHPTTPLPLVGPTGPVGPIAVPTLSAPTVIFDEWTWGPNQVAPAPVDHSAMKLGRRPKREDRRTLALTRYLSPALPPPPASVDWAGKVASWPMMRNDSVGDCTCAAAGHLVQEWTTYAAGAAIVPSDEQIIAAYSAITGYNPADPATDQGANELDVLNYWRQTGIAGRKITAYAAIDPTDTDTVRQAVNLFGGVYIGVSLPTEAQRQAVWDVVPGMTPGSWGGHAVPVVGYDAVGLTVVTWGALKRMTWAFWAACVEECYGIVSADWLAANGLDPQGLNLTQLLADLQAIPAPAPV